MKSLFLGVAVTLFLATIFSSCDTKQTYRLRALKGDKKIMVITHEEVKGLRKGDTVQLERGLSYPYDWNIKPGAENFSDTLYLERYTSASGDTVAYIVNRATAIIEEVVK